MKTRPTTTRTVARARARSPRTILVRALAALACLAVASAAALAAGGTVQVPIRWCYVQGSPSLVNPQCTCINNTIWLGVVRGFRASLSYRNCNVIFRGAGMLTGGSPLANQLTIQDPCDPAINPACPGQTGDIEVDLGTNNFAEYFQAVNACRAAWNATGASANGLIGVNVRRFVNGAGTPNSVAGLGGTPFFCSNASQAVGGQFAVVDEDYIVDYSNFPQAGGNVLGDICPLGTPHPSAPPCQPNWFTDSADVLTAHEVGHALSLGHLAGTAMNAFAPAPAVLTRGGFGMNALVCPAQPFTAPTSQCGAVRLQSICHQNGTVVDPPPVVDEHPLTIGDAAPGHIDLDLVGVVDDGNTSSASFFWRAIEGFPASASGLTYEFALDLDQDPGTGGDPTTVGIGIPLPGTDLAGSVSVDVSGGVATPVEFLWRFDMGGGAFVPEPALGSDAGTSSMFVDEVSGGTSPSVPGHATVSIDFDRALLSGTPSTYTFRARAFDPLTASEDLPAAAELYLVPPDLAVCSVLPAQASPGDMVTVESTGLNPSQNTVVLFDKNGLPVEVAAGTTDPAGFTSSSFVIPPGTLPGPRHVSILVDHPLEAVSAHCVVDVLDPAGTPGSVSGIANQVFLTMYDSLLNRVTLTYPPACGANDHTVYGGDLDLAPTYEYDVMHCLKSTSGTATVDAGSGNRFYLVVGNDGVVEGSYGKDSAGVERPEDTDLVSTCAYEQELAMACP